MHIHICRTHYPHWGAFSGINQFMKYINRERFSIGEQLVSDSDEDFPINNKIVIKNLRSLVQTGGMEWYKLSDLAAEMKILRRCLKGGVSIVHYLDGEHSAQFLPIIIKRLGIRKPRMIATFHQPSEILAPLLRKDVIQNLDLITVVSPEQIAYFRQQGVAHKVRLILHGVDTDYFSPGIFRQATKSFKCITVGHYLRDFKAIKEVAKKLSHRSEIEFNLVTANAYGMEDLPNVKVHKNVSDLELVELYRKADVLFLPLIQSTANNSLLEGIACGLPVISTMLTSVKSYLPGNEAILIMNNDPDRLAENILNLFENNAQRLKMAEAARFRAKELAWEKIGQQYEAIYSELCS